jgi:hypothetical protein
METAVVSLAACMVQTFAADTAASTEILNNDDTEVVVEAVASTAFVGVRHGEHRYKNIAGEMISDWGAHAAGVPASAASPKDLFPNGLPIITAPTFVPRNFQRATFQQPFGQRPERSTPAACVTHALSLGRKAE